MSGTAPTPRFFAAPLPGGAESQAATRAAVALYTPATLGWVAFLCGVPAGFVLAALNHRRMGEGARADTRLAAAVAIFTTLLVSPLLGPLGGLLALALLVGGIAYLVRDARAAAADYRTAHPAYDASGFQGFLLGLGVALLGAVMYLVFVGPLLG